MSDTATLTSALAAVQAVLPQISKDQTAKVPTKAGGSYTYTYSNLASITPQILPLLGQNGLAWITKPTYDEQGHFVLRYALKHVSGEEEGGDYPLPDPTRSNPQEIGSALTYARRYALCSVVGIAPAEDDDDGGKALETKAAPRQSKPEPRATDLQPLVLTLNKAERSKLGEAWKFPFASGAVPVAKVAEATALINSFKGSAPVQMTQDDKEAPF